MLKSPPVPAIREQLIEGPVLSQQLHSAMELQPPVERLEVIPVVVVVVVVVARSAHQQKHSALPRLTEMLGSRSGRGALPTLFLMHLMLTTANQ
jgi:hypothetical protein